MNQNPQKVAQLVNHGLQALQQGQLDAAKQSLSQALSLAPNHADALHYLGLVEYRLNQNASAEARLRKAIKVSPNYVQAHNNLGVILKEQGKYKQAKTVYQNLLKQKPDYADAHSNLGIVLSEMREAVEAKQSFERALKINPNHPDANNALGILLKTEKATEAAIACFKKSTEANPHHFEAFNNLGNAYLDINDDDTAAKCFKKAIQINPGYAEAYCNLGSALQQKGKSDEAKKYFESALKIDPQRAEFHYNMGWNHHDKRNYKEAAKYYKKSLELDPTNLTAHSDLLLHSNYDAIFDNTEVFKLHADWGSKLKGKRNKFKPNEVTALRNKEKLKIGFVSPDFRQHSVAYFFEPLLANLNPDRFESYCYYNHSDEDEQTERLKQNSHHWRETKALTTGELSKCIMKDGIDILFDLAGHTAHNRLDVFGLRSAPIQITWLGYPNTSGLSSMDFRLVDAVSDPIDSEQPIFTVAASSGGQNQGFIDAIKSSEDPFYSEELVRLPQGFLCYQGMDHVLPSEEPPCIKNGYITFGSFNNLVKINNTVLETWGALLKKLPSAKLLLKSKQLANPSTAEEVIDILEKNGAQTEQIIIQQAVASAEDHLRIYDQVDIALDPFPYNGTTTVFEAAWMGVPTLTLSGDKHAARVGTSIMTHLGLEQFIAKDVDTYLELASVMSQKKDLLSELRPKMRDTIKQSPMGDAKKFAAQMEDAIHFCIESLGSKG